MNAKIVAILVIFTNNFTICQSKKYVNYSLYTVLPTEDKHLEFLQNLNYQRYIGLSFWKKPHKLYEEVQFLVNPINKEMFKERARNFRVNTVLLIPDIQRAFDNQIIQSYKQMDFESYTWDAYHSLEDIYHWLSDMALKHHDLIELHSIGKSAEGRDIYAAIVRKKRPKYKVIVEGGIHGNEWISVEFVTYLLDQLTKINDSSHWKMTSLLSKYEWHLIPVVNPDGYAFTHKQDRLWRKNRKMHGASVGVDLNRNFDYKFGSSATSHDKNDEYYCGPHVFSEPESMALAKYITMLKRDLKFYIAFHGYGQKIIIPYVDKTNRNDNYDEAENYATQAMWKIFEKHGVRYSIGTSYDILGIRLSGDSASYVKKTHNVRFVYTFLLRDNGTYGHALPPDQILPTCQEMLTGLQELMNTKRKRVKLQFYNSSSRQRTGTIVLILLVLVLSCY